MNKHLLAAVAIVSGSALMAACSPSGPAAVAPVPAAAAAAPAAPAAPAIAAAAAPVVATPVQEAPAPSAAAASPAQAPVLVIQGFSAPVPAGWRATEPENSMRLAQYAVPGAGKAGPGEAAAFFFGPGQGGSHEANIARWASQFSAGGAAVRPKVDVAKSGDHEITLVELNGSYARGIGVGPEGEAKPDQTLLVAMIETAAGRITLQVYGPGKTVAAQRAAFVAMARSFRPA